MDLRKLARRYADRYEKFEENKNLSYVVDEFADFVKDLPTWDFDIMDDVFKLGKRLSAEFNVSANDVEVLFKDLLPEKVYGGLVGFFVSGLYNRILKDEDTLVLDGAKYRGTVSGIAYKHRRGKIVLKNCKALFLAYKMVGGFVEVFGNVRNYLGREMKDGMVLIHGNACDWVGFEMEGGRIVIEGNAGNAIGVNMKGGEIVVRGKAGFWIGEGKKGGRIIVGDSVF
jgi:hypothetical protein